MIQGWKPVYVILALVLALAALGVAGAQQAAAQARDEPTRTPTPTSTPTSTPTYTPTPLPTPTSTDTPTPLPTSTPLPSAQPPLGTSTATDTPVPPPASAEPPFGTATSAPDPSTSTSTPSPTRTVTPLWPTDTRTPTPSAQPPFGTWSATPACADSLEPNQQPGSGAVLVINQTVSNLTLYPAGDVDFFLLWGKAGRFYQVTTATGDGLDTRVRVFDPTGKLIAENDDYTPGNPASQARFQAPGEGWFSVAIDSDVPTDWGCRKYSVTAVDVSSPTATPTSTPGPPKPTATVTPSATTVPGQVMYDAYEPNYDMNAAANIGVGQTLNLNFNPYPAGSGEIDNDWFRLYVKAGERLHVETTSLAQGLDTNLVLYRDNGAVIAGNDDCVPGERYSCIEWSPDYTGLAYVLAGPVGTIPEATASGSRAYSLVIEDVAGQTPSPVADSASSGAGSSSPYGQSVPWPVTPLPAGYVATSVAAVATPPSSETGTPAPSATAPSLVRVRMLDLASPSPTPRPVQSVTIDLTVYYDENNNSAPDANEGVVGVSVRILNGLDNTLLGQSFTDGAGHANLTLAAPGDVRVSVPYLGYNQLVRAPGKSLTIRLSPMRLPSLIP
jgi:hypothetical protein